MSSSFEAYWLATLYLPAVKQQRFLQWLAHFPDIAAFFQASASDWREAGVTDAYIAALQQPNWQMVEKDLAWAQKEGQHIITYDDALYPSLLKEISDPPLVLFVRGNKTALSQLQIAMVGSRHASTVGMKTANEFAYHLAEVGFVITSGMALGIDGASHQGALAAKGMTIGVAGTGLSHTYPKTHAPLVADILATNGAVISEFTLNVGPHPYHFPKRNRIISGMSVGVLVVEAALKSGSLITALHALHQGREVFAIPGSIHHPLSRGCHYLIREGAKLVETAKDILEELSASLTHLKPRICPVSLSTNEDTVPLSPEQKAVFNEIGCEITPFDVILLRSGLTAGEVSSILLTLELNGCIQSVPGGYVRCVSIN